MKKIINILFLFTLVFFMNSCSDKDKTVDQILDVESGAVLRTVEVINATLNASEPSSEFAVLVEEQDNQDGALFKEVNLLVSIQDLTPDNGTTVAEKDFVKTIPASDFSTGPLNLPRGTISATFAEAVAAMGLSTTDYQPGDLFVFDLELVLTDGRKFDNTNAGSSITGGFFNSPFQYNSLIGCSPLPGDYVIDMQDSYGDGWQSDRGIVADIDGEETDILLVSGSSGSFTLTVPVGSESLTWNYTGDSFPGEVSFQVTGPGGENLGSFSEPTAGLLPILLCL